MVCVVSVVLCGVLELAGAPGGGAGGTAPGKGAQNGKKPGGNWGIIPGATKTKDYILFYIGKLLHFALH